MDKKELRILVIGAHPDDADQFASGTAVKFAAAGACVRFLSTCNGDKGHHRMSCADLAARRREETVRAAKVLGIDRYDVWDVPDCTIEPTLELRTRMTRQVREFAPHVIFTHRTCDYHADHRATAQLVQDMTYMLGVPHWCPETQIPPVVPAVFFMTDDFDFPRLLRPDVVVDVDAEMDRVCDAFASHVSQAFEWLPFDMKLGPGNVPDPNDRAAVRSFIAKWYVPCKRTDAARFRDRLVEWYGAANLPQCVEAFEMSRYGRQMSEAELRETFLF